MSPGSPRSAQEEISLKLRSPWGVIVPKRGTYISSLCLSNRDNEDIYVPRFGRITSPGLLNFREISSGALVGYPGDLKAGLGAMWEHLWSILERFEVIWGQESISDLYPFL